MPLCFDESSWRFAELAPISVAVTAAAAAAVVVAAAETEASVEN